MVPGGQITGQQISVVDLPDVVQEAGISDHYTFGNGIGELEELVRRSQERGEPIRIGVPGNDLLAKVLSHQANGHVDRIYWNVSPIAVHGIVDQVRTRLVELVAQIKADTSDLEAPASDVVTNALELAVYGRKARVTINAAQASGSGPATVTEPASKGPTWWRTAKGLGALAAGSATIAAAIIAWLQWK
jgi:hypothetical protein